MAESLADDLDGDAGLDEQRGVGVAEVVEPNDGNVGSAGDAFEGLGDGVWMNGTPAASPTTQPQSLSPTAAASVDCHVRHARRRSIVVGSRSMGRGALRVLPAGFPQFVADTHDPAVERDGPSLEVDVVPAQPEHLVASHAGGREEPEGREQPVPGGGTEECA